MECPMAPMLGSPILSRMVPTSFGFRRSAERGFAAQLSHDNTIAQTGCCLHNRRGRLLLVKRVDVRLISLQEASLRVRQDFG